MRGLAILVLLPLPLLACQKRERERAAPRPAPARRDAGPPVPLPGEWKDGELKTSAGRFSLRVYADGHEYTVTLLDLPRGTRWTMGAQKGIADRSVEMLTIDMSAQLGLIPIADIRTTQVDPGTVLRLDLPGGPAYEIALPPQSLNSAGLVEYLEKIDSGPVLFGDEPKEEKPEDSILFVFGGGWKVFGKATLLRDINAVARHHALPEVKRTKLCTGYASSGKSAPDLTLELKEVEVVIHDRRTGGVRARKVFPPDDECPMFTMRAVGEDRQDSTPPIKAIHAWLGTQVR
jgi:hypothetical protein